MGLRSFFQGNRVRAGDDFPAAMTLKPTREALSPEQLAELQEAWGELTQAAEDAGVINFRACTRDGTSWEEDPVAVRGLAATIRKVRFV